MSSSTRRQMANLLASRITEDLELTGHSAKFLDSLYSLLVDSLLESTEEELSELLEEIQELELLDDSDTESEIYTN